MGIEIKKKDDKFQMKSSVSGEIYHEEEWISEKEAKSILINKELWRFVRAVQGIEMEFPIGYMVNGKYVNHTHNSPNINEYILAQHKLDDNGSKQYADFLEVMHSHDIKLDDYNEDKITAKIADIRNKLSSLKNLVTMVSGADSSKLTDLILAESKVAAENIPIIEKDLQDILDLLD